MDKAGIGVSLFEIIGDLDEDRAERIGYWFSTKYHKPSTAYFHEGIHCLAVATDEILPPEIEDDKDNVKLKLIKTNHRLLFKNDVDRVTAENLLYRSIEQHFKKSDGSGVWLRFRSSRTYCEHTPIVEDYESGVQVFPCFNIYSEYQKDHSIALVIDSSSTLVETRSLLDAFKSLSHEEFESKYEGSNVLLTDEKGKRRTRYFVGIKKGYNIDSPLITSFRDEELKISVRDKYQNYNSLTNSAFDANEPVAEIKNFKGQNQLDYVPLSCLKYTPDLNDIKEENELISFSEKIYISPREKFDRVERYLSYFDDIVFGKYKNPLRLKFNLNPEEANGTLEAPNLRFGNGNVLKSKNNLEVRNLKFQKLNALKNFGYYRQSDLNDLIILHRRSFRNGKVGRFKQDLINALQEYSLPFSDSNVNIASQFENIRDLKKFVEGLDDEVITGIIPIVNDGFFDYKEVKEILNKDFLPSQAIREDTLSFLNPNEGKYKGMVQNVVSGIITKGGGIPWILSTRLTSDLIIGIDSGGEKKKRAWATAYVFDEYGEKIHVRNPSYYASEGIPKEDFKKLIIESVQQKLSSSHEESKIEGITIHRDGFLTKTEREGLESAITKLKLEAKLEDDFHCVSVNVKKTSNFRIFSQNGNEVENPPIGSYYILDENRAFVTTTGYPILRKPTAKPLLIELVNIVGTQDISKAVQDIYFLSELNWGSPSSAIKLPITIYYADKMVDFADYDSKPSYLPV